MLKDYIGDRKFYKNVLAVSVPIIIQQGITNFVSLLDNIMVGQMGTEAMSAVSIVNQFIFIFYLLIFGSLAAAGIFTAQYHGLGNNEGVRHTFRFKIILNICAAAIGIIAFAALDDQLISLFLYGENVKGDIALTLKYGKEYLAVMLVGLMPYAISCAYATTFRETGETLMPMIASISAVVTNFVFNLILIFGLLGFPALGVKGAAIATVISRYVELFILLLCGHGRTEKYVFLKGVYRRFRIPASLVAIILKKGMPLILNEVFWALSITLRNQCYSTRGLDVVAAQNITTTIVNLFNVVYLSLGSAIAIVVGNLLGAGKIDEAKSTDKKMIAFSIACASAMGIIQILTAYPFSLIYKTEPSVRTLAVFMIIFSSLMMPFVAYAHAAYFTMRTGGKVAITLLFDSIYMWVIVMPFSYVMTYFTGLDIYWLYILCQGIEALKCILGMVLLKNDSWAKQIVSNEEMK
ncbi:MAG: MATE family efflux transporter [Ruminococcaceae bacterium]|nr:MATE family efflux transporter [Oscillospiraceae bacterium]